jgi:NMD protein affecting ribosome stability and mRNA decay
MKREIRHQTTLRHQLRSELPLADPYAEAEHPHHPAVCTDCGAVFKGGSWAWGHPPRDAVRTLCAACLRIRDQFPAGHVSLRGPWVESHKAELCQLVADHEALALRERPLERVIGIDSGKRTGLTITTTGRHLARAIAHAVQDHYEGRLRVRFEPDDNLVQAVWSR